jgi:hypothetical protein
MRAIEKERTVATCHRLGVGSFLRNGGTFLPNYMASHLRRL